MHGSAFEGRNFMSLYMPWMTSVHLLPDDLSPYRAFRKIRIYPSSSWNSGPATMWSFSSVNASRYAFLISAPHSSRLLSLPRNITNLRFLIETTPEYIFSMGSGVRWPSATNLALCLPSLSIIGFKSLQCILTQ